jgi:hypothetical protein
MESLSAGLGVWLGEYKGQPASVNLFTIRSLLDAAGSNALPSAMARKNFFKGDKVVMKWNKAGTMVSTPSVIAIKYEDRGIDCGGTDGIGFVLDSIGCGQFGEILLRRDQSLLDRFERSIRVQGRSW